MGWALLGLFVAVVAGLISGGFGLSMWRRRWMIADTPTSDAAHVFVGTNEVAGRAEPVERALVAPFTGIEAVWYRSLLEKEVKNDKGSSSWRKVSEATSTASFWIEDESGRVLVRPDGASVYATERRRTTHSGPPERFDSFSLLRKLDAIDDGRLPITPSTGARHRSTEWVLRPGEEIYVLGDASLRDDVVALEFVAGRGPDGRNRSVYVSAGKEAAAARRTFWQGAGLFVVLLGSVVALPAALLGVATAASGGPEPGDPSTLEAVGGWMVVAAAVAIGALPVTYAVRLHNRLVDTRNRVAAAWALIDVQLRRRHDLLPELAEVVRAAAAHERRTQESTTLARSLADGPVDLPDQAARADRTRVDQAGRAQVAELLARVEGHPELQSDANHRLLVDQITATEDGVAVARTFYNDAITVMRDRRQRLPGLLIAWSVPVPDDVGLWEPDEPDARPSVAPAPVDDGS